MEVIIRTHFLPSPLSILSSSSFPSSRPKLSTSRCSISCSLMEEGRSKFLEFPFVSSPHKTLMLDLISRLENRFESQLLPCSLPSDVQHYQNQNGTSQLSLHIRPADHTSGTHSDSSVSHFPSFCFMHAISLQY